MTILSHPRAANQSRPPVTVAAATRRIERASVSAANIDPLRVLRRYLWAIVASGIIGGILGLAAYIILGQVYPLYSGMVVFEIRPGLQKSSDVGTMDISNDDMVFRLGQSEAYLLTSHDVLEAALRNPDVQNTAWAQQFYVKGAFSHGDAMDQLEKEIATAVRRSSNLFTLHWSAHRPSDVPVLLNAVGAAYTNMRQDRDKSMYDKNLMLFQGQLSETQHALQDVDVEIKKLIERGGLTTLEDTRGSAQFFQMQELTRNGQQMDMSLNLATSGLQQVRQQIEGRLEPNPEDIADAEKEPTVMQFTESVRFAKSDYRMKAEKLRPDNPQLLDAERRVRSMEAELDDKIKILVIRNLQSKATEFENSVKRLQAAVDQNAEDMEALSVTLKDLASKQSDLETLRSQREYLQKQRQTDMDLVKEVRLVQLRSDAARVELAQPAFTPREPSFPKAEIVIPLGVLLALALTVGLIFLREMLDKRVKSASDLATLPGARVLGSLPDASDDPTRIVSPEMVVRREPGSILAESYRQASTAILQEMDQAEAQTLLLMGGLPEAGTTTVATNLASAAAGTGRSVLLVDANFRRPGLARALGISEESVGLGDVLSNGAAIDEAIHDIGEGVSLLPAGTPTNRVFERLNNGVIDGVLADLRSRYDLIIFDTPPAVVAGDALMLASKLDAAVLVIRANQEHRGLVARMINRLADTHCHLIGVLLNRPRGIAGGYLKKNYATMAEYGPPIPARGNWGPRNGSGA